MTNPDRFRPEKPIYSAENRAIGRRVAEVYHALGLNQRVFAERIGVSDALLGAYVIGRLALPTAVFKAMKSRFWISAKWLATGEGPLIEPHRVSVRAEAPESPRRFVEAWKSSLKFLSETDPAADVANEDGPLSVIRHFIERAKSGDVSDLAIVALADAATELLAKEQTGSSKFSTKTKPTNDRRPHQSK